MSKEYTVRIYFNGIYWDETFPADKEEAERWRTEIEDKSKSIWDRVNGDALMQFIKEYDIIDEESIEITAEVVADSIYSEEYVPSSENGDYSPSNPWDAPGMSIRDFI